MLLVVLVAVKVLLPVFPSDLANDVGFLRMLVVCLVGIYVLFEVWLVCRHFGKLERRSR